MHKEISLDIEIKELFVVYSDPARDKRFHTASVVYICKAYGTAVGADGAKEATTVQLKDLELDKLVFDHGKILKDYLNKHHSDI